MLEKIANQDTSDYTVNYKTVGRQNGTIEFKDSLYNSASSSVGFDTISFDTKIYDGEPIDELTIILAAIKDAQAKASQRSNSEMQRLQESLGLPADMKLPF